MKRLIVVLMAFLALVGCMQKEEEKNPKITKTTVQHIPGEVVVQGSIVSIRRFFQASNIQIATEDRLTQTDDIYRLRLAGSPVGIDMEKVIAGLRAATGVKFVEYNFAIKLNANNIPKDPMLLKQWAIRNIGQDSPTGAQGVKGADIGAFDAWKISKGSRDIVVGIVDTGIDYSHPDLKDNIWVNEKERDGLPGVDDDGNGYADDVHGWNFVSQGLASPYYGQLGRPDPMDDNSHGTHVAGIIGATGDNYTGIIGVNWNVSMMALKFLDSNGSGSSWDAARAIQYGINNGVDILSNSWGGGDASQLVLHMIEKASEKGVLFVAAAGNEGSNNDVKPSFPANYKVENVLSVAATDNKDRMASFSCYGNKSVHIAAPGVDVLSSIPVSKVEREKLAYASFSGTSMATPYVSGAAALLLAAVPELRGKPALIKERLMNTADVKTQLAGLIESQGRLNVFRALKNDVNQPKSAAVEVRETVQIRSARYNTELFDKVWEVSKPGAQMVRLHFKYAMVEAPAFDLLAVYDKFYHRVFNVETEYPGGFWTPWIIGDTANIRMANALVATQTTVEIEYENDDVAFKDGATNCSKLEGTKVKCSKQELSKPYANFESEGFEVDEVEYRMERGEVL